MTTICSEEYLLKLEDRLAELRAQHEELIARTAEIDPETYEMYREYADEHQQDEAIEAAFDAMRTISEAFEQGARTARDANTD